MNTIRSLLDRLKLVLLAAGFVCAFHYAGFHEPGSILLGGSFALVAVWLYELRKLADFKPYKIIVGVKFDAICKDFELPFEGAKSFENFHYTAITAGVFAQCDERKFSSDIYIGVEIPCAPISWHPGPGSSLRDRPRFFFYPYGSAYRFGVQVDSEWWSHHKSQLGSAMRSLPIESDGSIVLGVLPHGYIPDHVRRWHGPGSFFYPFNRKQRQWKTDLAKNGWTVSEDDPTNPDHRYLRVAYYRI